MQLSDILKTYVDFPNEMRVLLEDDRENTFSHWHTNTYIHSK